MAVTIKTAGRNRRKCAAPRNSPPRCSTWWHRMSRPGVSTDELDRICHEHIVNVQKVVPANIGYRGFPKTLCTSVNHVVCHGIPGDKALKDGDIINIDTAVIVDGFHGDTSRMYFVGEPSIQARRLVETTYEAMKIGHRNGAPRRAPGRHRSCDPDATPKAGAIRWCASIAATASGASTTRIRRCCTTANRAPDLRSNRA